VDQVVPVGHLEGLGPLLRHLLAGQAVRPVSPQALGRGRRKKKKRFKKKNKSF